MTKASEKALLPAGLQDVLPPEAAHEAEVVARLVDCFAAHGYERVKPPLIEFEESLLAGAGATTSNDNFRIMDPISQRMMAVRADITLQVARIATTRLRGAPRPLRLSYAGDVLRVRGTQLRAERQFGQVGVELIGAPQTAADVEIVLLVAEALGLSGLERLSIDLTSPTLVPEICRAHSIEGDALRELRTALDRKDAAAVAEAAGAHAPMFAALLDAAGPAERALAALEGIDLPGPARAEADRLAEVSRAIMAAGGAATLTIDPVENRGFEYHTGVAFSVFAPGARGEVAAGGRYLAGHAGGVGEPATGATLYLDSLLRALPAAQPARHLFLPLGTAAAEGKRLRAEGWATVAALEDSDDALPEARRLGCSHALVAGNVVAVS